MKNLSPSAKRSSVPHIAGDLQVRNLQNFIVNGSVTARHSPGASAEAEFDPDAFLDNSESEYLPLIHHISNPVFMRALEGKTLFKTDCGDIFATYLNSLPAESRQHYNCNSCRRFINTYGGLVTVEGGRVFSVFWSRDVQLDMAFEAPLFLDSIRDMRNIVEGSPITGVFYSSEKVWGDNSKQPWQHLHAVPSRSQVYSSLVKTAGQAMAEKQEEYRMLVGALIKHSEPVIRQAVALLKTDRLNRGGRILPQAEWFLDRLPERHNSVALWEAVGSAPAGWCHVNSSALGSLLDDLVAEMPMDTVIARFNSRMDPLQYLRPQAAPKAGNIAQAEKVIEALSAQGSLNRRYARLDEIQAIWTPPLKAVPRPSGVFGHLHPSARPAAVQQAGYGSVPITFEKFRRTVMGSAEKMEVYTSNGQYTAFVTAADFDAAPILQWDQDSNRNPVSCYVYAAGSGKTAAHWNLPANSWITVKALALRPHMWGLDDYSTLYANQAKGAVFILDGAKDTGHIDCGNALFPEILKSELHGIRSTLEAYSRNARMGGYEESSACGMGIGANGGDVRVRVTAGGIVSEYSVDRWD